MGIDHNTLYAELEAMGEAEVRITLAKGLFLMGQETNLAQEWLRVKDEERVAASSSKRNAREEEILSIAKEANRIASEARAAAFEQARWAKWAAIVATVAAIIAVAFSK